ncbi:hypothetical protein QC762_302700 [Podospora pseudocomata]|uniref:HD domain-containing protein n=1 Tax=Podospora pseudocomata TaxID=2093779 RepID=A0ABR0GI81_9PEZI|nr:hypothetical protein QC762_302700 [Podospora pseudocomata]
MIEKFEVQEEGRMRLMYGAHISQIMRVRQLRNDCLVERGETPRAEQSSSLVLLMCPLPQNINLASMMTLISDHIRDKLKELYSHTSRHYHTLNHIEALLTLLSTHREKFHDPEAIEAAIWFHDAIYNVHAQGNCNEVQSAQLAGSMLSGLVDATRLKGIQVMIEATATHTVPDELQSSEVVADAALFLDIDLSVLGAEEEAFDEYEGAVRKEYGHVDEQGWREGRAAVLRGFLDREWIYHSDIFRGLLEEKARANLRRSLERFSGSVP